jgi:hypothetical protein
MVNSVSLSLSNRLFVGFVGELMGGRSDRLSSLVLTVRQPLRNG